MLTLINYESGAKIIFQDFESVKTMLCRMRSDFNWCETVCDLNDQMHEWEMPCDLIEN